MTLAVSRCNNKHTKCPKYAQNHLKDFGEKYPAKGTIHQVTWEAWGGRRGGGGANSGVGGRLGWGGEPEKYHQKKPKIVQNFHNYPTTLGAPNQQQRLHDNNDYTTTHNTTTTTMGRGIPWNNAANIQLSKSWLATSEDPIVGRGQTGDEFWKRIHTHFLKHGKPENPMRPDRRHTQKSITTQWRKIRTETSKFVGCFEMCNANRPSGTGYDDAIIAAHVMFESDTGNPYKFFDCWEVLGQSAKFRVRDGKWGGSNTSNGMCFALFFWICVLNNNNIII